MTNKNEIVDIVSKPVGITYERVQTLGIYCWQEGKKEKLPPFFLSRLSFNSNKDYLESLYPGISNKTELQGKGIFTSVWRIAKYYEKVSIINPENTLSSDKGALSAFKAWVQSDEELRKNRDDGKEVFLQMYVLEDEARFANYKYTTVQNSAATIYYDWSEILEKQEVEGKVQD